MTSIFHQQIFIRKDFSSFLSPFFVSFSIFSSIKSPSHGAAIYVNNQQAQFIIEDSYFYMCKCQGNMYYGGCIYAAVGIFNSSRVCISKSFSFDNGASYSIWNSQITTLRLTAWCRCGEQHENAEQDSCVLWETRFIIVDSNSSHNYMYSHASSIAINAKSIDSEVLFSTFLNNSRDSAYGSFWMQGHPSRVYKCNFIQLCCTNAAIVTHSSYGYSIFEYSTFQNLQGSYIFSMITTASVLQVRYCIFDLSSIPYQGLSLTLEGNTMSSVTTQIMYNLEKIVCNNDIIKTNKITLQNPSLVLIFTFCFL